MKIKKKEKYHPHVESTVAYFVKTFPEKNVMVLDVGTRDGYAVELLKKEGYNVIGIDIVPEYVRYAIEKRRNVIVEDIMNPTLFKGMFDLIFSRHCVEHCDDTLKFLENCKRLLKPDGKIFLTFPLETKKKFDARDDDFHKVYFGHKDDFRKIANKVFKEKFFGKTKKLGIKTDGREVLYIGYV